MYDPYSEPNYNPGGGAMPQQPQGFQMPKFDMPSFDTSGLQGPSIDFKKFIPIIVVLVIIAIIGIAVLTWLGMQHTVTINLTDTDGNPVEGRLILKDTQGNTIKSMNPKVSSDTFSGTLMEGDYIATIPETTGYNKATSSIKVTSDKTSFTIKIARNLNATLSLALDYTKIYDGQIISGKLSIQNNGEPFNLSDVISASSENIDAKIINTSPETINQGPTILDFNAKLKNTAPLTKITTASVQFKVSGTSVLSEKTDLQAIPVVSDTEIEISPSGKISSLGLTAGARTTLTITITNKNRSFPIENLLLTINTDNSDYTQNLDWAEFTQSVPNQPNSILIENIDPNDKEPVTLNITPPITADVADAFLGYLSLTSYSIKREKRSDVEFKVSTAKKAALQLSGLDTTYTVRCYKSTSNCETKPLPPNTIKFKNSGTVDIANVEFKVDLLNPASTTNCQQYLTRFVTTNTDPLKIPLIKAGAEESISVDITAFYEDTSTFADCVISWKYLDPLSSPPVTVTDSKPLHIIKTTTT